MKLKGLLKIAAIVGGTTLCGLLAVLFVLWRPLPWIWDWPPVARFALLVVVTYASFVVAIVQQRLMS